jgi:flagellar biosynthesis GTPase FlhF
MIIKSFTAPTVGGALKLIRDEMGGNAVVLKTRVCPPSEAALTGNQVEVTACIDESTFSPRNKVIEKTSARIIANDSAVSVEKKAIPVKAEPPAENNEPDLAMMLEKKLDLILNSHRTSEIMENVDRRVRPIYLNLLDADIPVEIAGRLANTIVQKLDSDGDAEKTAYRVLYQELKETIAPEIVITPGMRVAFVGLSGAGKTSALAKLAAHLSTGERKKVTLTSLDNIKISAFEEIGGYAQMLDLPLEMSSAVDLEPKKGNILLIDTPSLTCNEKESAALAARIKVLRPDVTFLVFSAATRTRDLIDLINIFGGLTPTYLIGGHLDETQRWGGLLAMPQYLDVPLAYVSDTSGGSALLKSPEPAQIARQILKIKRGKYEK